MNPKRHINNKNGCPLCFGTSLKSNDQFIKECNIKHNNRYDYSITNYTGLINEIEIICKIHGKFVIGAKNHIHSLNGCKKCSISKGELLISNFLDNENIKYNQEYCFNNCKNKKQLPFDFYIKELNTCIEFDGEQHFNSVEYFGGEKKLKYIQRNDEIKNTFCKNNDIKLIRIPYTEIRNIDKILKKEILLKS